ncbi:MAG TPA: hypothetical protein K8V79_06930 [Acinetobacter lwoffii]|uniref:Uncharacterized protein n=1 Tax=Acinetobacter lwoffii TaxID=28090 RepID=A0A9D2US86_ACILW|nr:hypothetical protein [Acinetobacter lwoffii]
MKPTWTARSAGLKSNCNAAPQPVEVLLHSGRQMEPEEINFISSVQTLPLEGVALVLCKYADNEAKLELIRIAMKFHIYRNEFDIYLKNNKQNQKVKTALDIWKSIKGDQIGFFKA